MQKNYELVSRKDIILREAARLFYEKGFNATTLRELAKYSGIKGGTIYHHFDSKQEILYQIMATTFKTLISSVQKAIKSEKTAYERLRQAVKLHVEYYIKAASETYVSDAELEHLTPAQYEKIAILRERYEQLFVEIMNDGIAEGELRIKDVGLAAKALIQMCTGVSYWFKPDGPLSATEIAENYFYLFFWGGVGRQYRVQ